MGGACASFGEGDDAPAIAVTMRDARCSMVNWDPDSHNPSPEVLKAVVRAQPTTTPESTSGHAQPRPTAVGQTVVLHAAAEKPKMEKETAMMRCTRVMMCLLVAAVATRDRCGRELLSLERLKERDSRGCRDTRGPGLLEGVLHQTLDAGARCGPRAVSGSRGRRVSEEYVIALTSGARLSSDALVSPNDEGLKCVAERLKATGFIRPPHDGFAIYMPLQSDGAGAEGHRP